MFDAHSAAVADNYDNQGERIISRFLHARQPLQGGLTLPIMDFF